MARFMLLMLDSAENMAAWSAMSADEMQAAIGEYSAWADRLAEQGRLLGGEKLRDGSGRVLRGTGTNQRMMDGPYTETKELIGGYFIVEADDYEHAVQLAADCPQLAHGGTVEVREIEEMAVECVG